jgi:hypothetical protein
MCWLVQHADARASWSSVLTLRTMLPSHQRASRASLEASARKAPTGTVVTELAAVSPSVEFPHESAAFDWVGRTAYVGYQPLAEQAWACLRDP